MSNETNYYKINTLFLPILELRLTSSTDYANMIKENKNLDILDEKGNFSWEKLQKFININMVDKILIENQKTKKNFLASFKQCEEEDFSKFDTEQLPENRFCPNIQQNDLIVKNEYKNKKDRISFSLEIHKCIPDPKLGRECESDSNIRKVLEQIYFTFTYVSE